MVVDEPLHLLEVDRAELIDQPPPRFRRELVPAIEEMGLAGLVRFGDANFVGLGLDLDHDVDRADFRAPARRERTENSRPTCGGRQTSSPPPSLGSIRASLFIKVIYEIVGDGLDISRPRHKIAVCR